MRERKGHLQARKREIGEQPPLFLEGMFGYSLRLVEAEIEWLEKFIEKLAA